MMFDNNDDDDNNDDGDAKQKSFLQWAHPFVPPSYILFLFSIFILLTCDSSSLHYHNLQLLQPQTAKVKLERSEMGNHKFRFSDMIPNALIHKLKDMGKLPRRRRKPSDVTAKNNSPVSLPRPSGVYSSNTWHDRSESHFHDPNSPRRSFNTRRAKRKTVYKPSHYKRKITGFHNHRSSDCLSPDLKYSSGSCVHSLHDDGNVNIIPLTSFDDQPTRWPHFSSLEIDSSANDIVIDIQTDASAKKSSPKNLVSGSRKPSANSPGMKLRVNSPRIQVCGRRSVSRPQSQRVLDSFAVVKRSTFFESRRVS